MYNETVFQELHKVNPSEIRVFEPRIVSGSQEKQFSSFSPLILTLYKS